MLLVPFRPDSVVDYVSIQHINLGAEIVPVSFLRQRDNIGSLDHKLIHFRVLSVTKGTPSTSLRVNTVNQFGPKRRGGVQSALYDRFWIVADLANPPYCAVFLTRTSAESSSFAKTLKGNPFVGADFLLHEPGLSLKTIGDHTPIVPADDMCLIPLKDHDDYVSTENLMRFPTEVGNTQYFTLVGKEISLHRITVQDSCCTGIQCDRQKGNEGCTCFYQSSKHGTYLYSFDVQFDVPRTFDTTGSITVPKFRSLQTTALFFQDFVAHSTRTGPADERNYLQERRASMNEMVDFVNYNGGWTLCGWYQLGGIADASSAQNAGERIENSSLNVHLCKLVPSEYNTKMRDSDSFKKLKIKSSNPVIDLVYDTDAAVAALAADATCY